MSDSVYIYSTASQKTAYTLYTKASEGALPVAVRSVTLNAGANIADKNLVTPYGVVTKVSAEDYELLKENRSFKTHLEAGFLKVGKSKTDPNQVAKDLVSKDKSAQPTEEELLDKSHSISETLSPAEVNTSNKVGNNNSNNKKNSGKK